MGLVKDGADMEEGKLRVDSQLAEDLAQCKLLVEEQTLTLRRGDCDRGRCDAQNLGAAFQVHLSCLLDRVRCRGTCLPRPCSCIYTLYSDGLSQESTGRNKSVIRLHGQVVDRIT